MKCQRIKRQLSDYVDETLSSQESKKVASHLEACPNCAKERDRLARLVKTVSKLGGSAAPWDLWPGIQRRLQIAALRPDRRLAIRRFLFRPMVAVPALGTAVAVVGIALSAFWGGQSPPSVNVDTKFFKEYARAYSHYRSRQAFADVDALTAEAELAGKPFYQETTQ